MFKLANIKTIFKLLSIVLVILVVFLVYKQCETKEKTLSIEEQSALIEKQIRHVSKLVVTEGTFSQVYNFKDQKKYFFEVISFQKKALMVVNSEVSVQYDLKKLDYTIDVNNKKIIIKGIPKEEIKINPSIQFYDVEDSYFNPFKGEDYNKITQKVTKDIKQKIMKSDMIKNAQNRLLSELASLFIVSNTLGWEIEYLGEVIQQEDQLLIPFIE